ncbi:MAG: heavy metal translocating P-type ATPase [Ferruginibacter sp.]
MENISWKVEGMNCTNCALSINRYLRDQGLKNVKVNFIGGDVSFESNSDLSKETLKKGIKDLGYQVVSENGIAQDRSKTFFKNHFQRFLFCLPFTLVLMLHMLPWHIHFLMNPWIQLAICLPVYIVGMGYFGKSAIKSLQKGIPNMNVLVATGATAAFIYSLIGSIYNMGMDFIFYETTATIITLVFMGEWIEHKSIQTTQKALNELAGQQKVMANIIAFDDQNQEIIFPIENSELHIGDLILIKTGEQVPMDCSILSGEAQVNEALLTGESTPLLKQKKDQLIGGSMLLEGNVRAQVTAVGNDTVLSNILNLVKQAQSEKPPVQQLADKISAIFVPVVIGISILSFLINYFVIEVGTTASLMRSIAVLVISCPCAMGLATPAAIAVGLGRAARKGILFRNARSLELFKDIRTVVFDKTGTLTRGDFLITAFHSSHLSEVDFKQIVASIEKYSNHPIAKAITKQWNTKKPIFWSKTNEIKGKGIEAFDTAGNTYLLGAYQWLKAYGIEPGHTIYLIKNEMPIGWVDMADALRPESLSVIQYLQAHQIKTVLLSGDDAHTCKQIADQLGIKEVYAEKSPSDKLLIIEQLNREEPVAMVGDGINDAPALAKATIGISMSEATQIAVQTAQVVLMNKGIQNLPLALGLGKYTYKTIQGNLFWAFIYNIIAIPIAAAGFLQPGIAALTMGFSDIVLAANSIRLNYRKVT